MDINGDGAGLVNNSLHVQYCTYLGKILIGKSCKCVLYMHEHLCVSPWLPVRPIDDSQLLVTLNGKIYTCNIWIQGTVTASKYVCARRHIYTNLLAHTQVAHLRSHRHVCILLYWHTHMHACTHGHTCTHTCIRTCINRLRCLVGTCHLVDARKDRATGACAVPC